ncbi:hypothetical protein [uncultured Bradyrhizobium sp.]|jgi:hypothetical protein|uniref:hypothetical protein n=1 Tax=uncultured Bradyrhizobium sp. TaxID=199684 RepID=UPI00260C1404|nr:hypothetical protein [uncultured Bradyrhizobium sp.]
MRSLAEFIDGWGRIMNIYTLADRTNLEQLIAGDQKRPLALRSSVSKRRSTFVQ